MNLFGLLTGNLEETGFSVAGAVDIDRAFESGLVQDHIQKYDEWLAAGYAGAMEYLVRGRERRADPRKVFAEARSVFCVAVPYSAKALGALDASEGPRYARYIRGADYHKTVAEKLERHLEKVSAIWSAAGNPPLNWKVCVDTSAVLERSWAALSGLGWIGKNTLLIHPRLGSYFLIGIALLNQEVGRGPSPLPDFCGNCDRCLKACPTGAFREAHVLDSNRCISYWTLEKRGKLEIPAEARSQVGSWVAGCDACQEACPFNRKSEKLSQLEPGELPAGAADLTRWVELIRETDSEYRARIKDSSLSRVKPAQFRRNLAIAFLNAVENGMISDQTLPSLLNEARRRFETETDPVALEEWTRTLQRIEAIGSISLRTEIRKLPREPHQPEEKEA